MAKVNYFQKQGEWFFAQGHTLIISPLGERGTIGTTSVHLFWVNPSYATGPRSELGAPSTIGEANAPEIAEITATTVVGDIPDGTLFYLTTSSDGSAPATVSLLSEDGEEGVSVQTDDEETEYGCYLSFAD